MTLGQRIYQLRKEHNLSQGDLADVLDVSRQSISKWETDTSVPELDKLVRLADVFGISLDALVRGECEQSEPNEKTMEQRAEEVIDTEPYMTRETCYENADHNIYYSENKFPPRKIVGTILLCMGALIFVLFMGFGGFLEGLILALPFVSCGAICFIFHRRIGLWCAWTLYFIVDVFLYLTSSVNRNRVRLSFAGFYVFDIVFIVSLISLLCLIVLIAISIYSFRRYETDFDKSAKKKIAISVAAFAISILYFLIIKNIVTGFSNGGVIYEEYIIVAISNIIIDWLQIFAFTMLIIVISAIIRKKRKN